MLGLLIATGAEAGMSGISILSEQYHVWGVCYADCGPYEDSYDITSSSYIEGSVSIEASSAASSVREVVDEGREWLELGAVASGYMMSDPYCFGSAYAASSACLLFKPMTVGTLALEIRSYAPSYGGVYITLSDTTTNVVLLDEYHNIYLGAQLCPVDPTHEYEFFVQGDTVAQGDLQSRQVLIDLV
jgi:hypothetical protein